MKRDFLKIGILLLLIASMLSGNSRFRMTANAQSAPAIPRSPEGISFELTAPVHEILVAIAKKSGKHIVSVIPQRGTTNADEELKVKGSLEAVLLALTTRLKAMSALQNETILIYRLAPEWLEQSPTQPFSPYAALPLLDIFINSLPANLKQKFVVEGKVSIQELTSEQKQMLVGLFSSLLGPEAPDANSVAFIGTSKGDFVLRLVPQIFVYEDHKPVGVIYLDRQFPPSFMPVDSLNMTYTGSIDEWIKPKILIEPGVVLAPDDAKTSLNLNRPLGIWSTTELLQEIHRQGGPEIAIDKRIRDAKISLFISNGQWNLDELLRAACSTLGYELRYINTTYFLSPSRTHKEIAALSVELAQAELAQQSLLKSLKPQLDQPKFTQVVKPFENKYFAESMILELTKLSDEQRALIGKVTEKELVPESTQAYFVLNLMMSVGDQDNNLIVGPIGTTLTSISPYRILKRPQDSKFQPYDSTAFMQRYGARVTILDQTGNATN